MVPADVLEELRAVVGPDHVRDDPDVVAAASRDWTGRFVGRTPAVVEPASTAEVADVLARCDAGRVAVVPQGGNTGLVGGGVPLRGEVVLSTRRLRRVDPVDRLAGQITVGAGVTLGELQRLAGAAGYAYGVDLAARDTATVGGTVATNAGGMRVIRYGSTRAQLVGVEAVLADGRVLSHLGGLLKDNTGYDLPGLVCGSEGTLAVVTAARLRLVPLPGETVVALVTFASMDAAVAAVGEWRRTVPGLSAAEFFLQQGLELVCEREGLPRPFDRGWPVYVLLEAAGHDDPTGPLGAAVASQSGVCDAAVANDTVARARLWRYREDHSIAINSLGPPHKLDVTLPFERLAAFLDEVGEVVTSRRPGASVWLFGHIGDGNVHVNVTGVDPDDDDVDDAVFGIVASMGGSISAEHGIGTAKRRWLHLSRSPVEIETFRAVKRALDPNGILNPNALLPA